MTFKGSEHLLLLMSPVGAVGAIIIPEDEAVFLSLSTELGNRIFTTFEKHYVVYC